MKKPGKTFFLQALLLMLLLKLLAFSSCQQEELCEELTQNYLHLVFYQISAQDTSLLTLEGVSVYGLGLPDTLIYNDVQAQRLDLPLDASRDSSAFVLLLPTGTDTLQLSYLRDINLVSVECGFIMHFFIQDAAATNNVIHSIRINNTEVINTADEHIEIYLPAAAVPLP